MPINSNDKSLIGQYIRAIENPDSIGYKNGKWYQSLRKGDDINNRGFGVDVRYNKNALALTKGRSGNWLSEKEERDLRDNQINYLIERLDANTPPLAKEPSEAKKAMAVGLLYRGDGIKAILNNESLRNAYYSGTDKDFENAIINYYRSKGLNERAKLHTNFMNEQSLDDKVNLLDPAIKLKNTFENGGSLNTPKQWNDLSLSDKSEIMKVAVKHGMRDLKDIRQAWNEFADGGYMPSASIKKDIAGWEGSSMKTNRSFDAEAKDFNRVIPEAVRNKLSQKQLDALYSYGYNVGMGNLKDRVLPTLTAYTMGRAGAEDVAKSMWASKDPYMRGLQRRRSWERNMFIGNSPVDTQGSIVDKAINMDLSSLPTENNPINFDDFPPNPTNYGTPTDYSSLQAYRANEDVDNTDTTEDNNNGLGIFSLMQQAGLLGNNKQTMLASTQPIENKQKAMFTVGAPVHNDTLLDDSWFKEGGYLYKDGGDKYPTIFKTSDGYTTASGHPVEQIGWDDNGYARYRDTVTGDLGHAFEPSEAGEVTDKMPTLIDLANNYARNYSLNQMMNDASVASSDNTYLADSGKEQNPNLKYQGLQGAMANAAWEKEHPYLSKASLAASAVPFAVAAYPFAAGAGEAAYPFVESAMQSSWFPYADAGLTAIGGADAANDIYNGNVNAMTALEIAPMAQIFKPLTYSLKGAANTVRNLYDEGALWDRYTTLGGRFGNYSDNPFVNVYATAARRFGLPDKPRVPADAMRKLKFENGEIIPINNGEVTFTGGRTTAGKPHMNSTTDRQVTRHKFGWDGMDGYIFPTQDFINQTLPSGSLKSIEPSDMFANGANVSMPVDKITLISGDTGTLKAAKEAGMQTLSSPRLRRMYNSKWNEYQANRFLNKKPKDIEIWQPYADEINRLMGTRGTPTVEDYRLLEQKTGLNAGVAPISEYQRAIDSLNNMLHASITDISKGAVKQYVYPNGRAVDWDTNSIEKELDLIKRAKYNNVFYDPATWAEYNWKMTNGIKDK